MTLRGPIAVVRNDAPDQSAVAGGSGVRAGSSLAAGLRDNGCQLGCEAMPNVKTAKLEKLTEGSFLFCSPQGNILFGCPPEILKRILASNLPMPDTVLLPEKLHHFHSSQASLEFPLYHFLFVQRGLERRRRFQVVANRRQCDGLAEMLRVTVVGPTAEEMI